MSTSSLSGTPRIRRRARLASCRAAVGDLPMIAAISSNEPANMSGRTKAMRPLGVRERAEHAVRDSPHVRAVLLELLCEPFVGAAVVLLVHVTSLSSDPSLGMTNQTRLV